MGKVKHNERRFDFILYDIKWNDKKFFFFFLEHYEQSMFSQILWLFKCEFWKLGSNLNYLFRIKTC